VIFATRFPEQVKGLEDLKGMVQFGASPRASIWLARAVRAYAFMNHRGYCTSDDVKTLAPDILRHRVIPTYEAEAREVTSDDIIQRILEVVEVP
jgi:MoxR-like ATPase